VSALAKLWLVVQLSLPVSRKCSNSRPGQRQITARRISLARKTFDRELCQLYELMLKDSRIARLTLGKQPDQTGFPRLVAGYITN
jgi:hypothetical protein